MNVEIKHDLEALATAYVVGGLSQDEMARFEQQLAVDQAAREAVAAAVELTQATAIALGSHSVSPAVSVAGNSDLRRPWREMATAFAIAASLLLALGLGWAALAKLDGPMPVVEESFSNESASETASTALAANWSRAAIIALEPTWADDLHESEGFDASHFVAGEDEPLIPVAPSWMLAAVSGMREQIDLMNDIESHSLPSTSPAVPEEQQ